MPTFKAIKNLSATATFDFDIPFENAPVRPAFDTKDQYRHWCLQPDTDHIFVSPFVGLTPTLRVAQSNKPLSMVGFIADYDSVFAGDPIAQIVANIDPAYRPAFISSTFSGGLRAWFIFEAPILFHEEKVIVKFVEKTVRGLGARLMFPGFDLTAAKSLSQTYEVGTNWRAVPDSGAIPLVFLEGWMSEAILEASRNLGRGHINIPIEQVREALMVRYPETAWPGGWGAFVVGARGTRFWDGGTASSCIVREDGLTCFTGDRPFIGWKDLLGNEWVRQHTDIVVGEAIAGLYFEAAANRYWRKAESIGWHPVAKEDLKLHLRVAGISDTRAAGEPLSPVDRLIHQIQLTHPIAGAFPFHFNRNDLVLVNGQPFLNSARSTLAQPDASASGKWGDGFPSIAAFYEGFYDRANNPSQFAHALGAIMYFYQTAHAGSVQRGRVIIHAGPPGVGKTYYLNIWNYIFGVLEDASRYLFALDSFNGSLCAAPIWGVDDPVSTATKNQTALFSQMLKQVAACDSIAVRGMYRETLRLPWLGRVLVNMNDDPESIRLLPSTEINLMDKVELYLVKKPFAGKFPDNALIKAEIPAFCAFLLEGREWLEGFEPDLFSDPRWGTTGYHHPSLVATAQGSQASTSAAELLNLWRKIWFEQSSETVWVGDPTSLMDCLCLTESLREVTRASHISPETLSRTLAQLCLRESPPGWLSGTKGTRIYTIYRSDTGATDELNRQTP